MFLIKKSDNEDEQEEYIIQAPTNDHVKVDILPSNFLHIFFLNEIIL